jgi:phosphoserine phosphatase
METEFTLVATYPIPNFFQALASFVDVDGIAVGHLSARRPDMLVAKVRESLVDAEGAGIKPRFFRPRALFFDMDSTVIGQETIVELARAAGKSEEVARITQDAMEGKLDFRESLTRRVAVLKGLPASVIEDTIAALVPEPGIGELIAQAKGEGIPSYLISGGFLATAEPIARRLSFAGFHANSLKVVEGRLTGELFGEIVDGPGKSRWLEQMCSRLGVLPGETVAIGDGANDIPMMEKAGLAIGYDPKPVLLPHLHVVNRSKGHGFSRKFLFEDHI